MTKKYEIEFVESPDPITEAVTKFGGEPVWIGEPQWPLSRSTGNPMQFICQIAIDPELFGLVGPKMAYIFMTDEDEPIDGTWEPDSGENAVILQPGVTSIPVDALTTGPTLVRRVDDDADDDVDFERCEFAVNLFPAEDPEYVPECDRYDWSDDQWDEYHETDNKIGGSPNFLQNEEFPGPGRWNLLLQLDSCQVPFEINFGDAGIGYAFLSADGRVAKFLWQCS